MSFAEALRIFLRTPSGVLAIGPTGVDSANDEFPILIDLNRIVRTRPYEGFVQVDPVLIPVAEGILWNPGADATETYEVEFMVVNIDAGLADVAGVYVGVDLAAAGALAAPNYWMFNETIPHPGNSGWRKGNTIAGDDDIRGVAGVVNDAAILFRIKRIDTGA